MMHRTYTQSLKALLLCCLLAGCGAPVRKTDSSPADRALASAVRYLVTHQSPDGAWRSDTYGTFRDGPALTPLVLQALNRLPDELRPTAACDKAADWLAAIVQPDRSLNPPPQGFDYPVYTAAFTVTALSDPRHAKHGVARDAWLTYLRERQLTESLGWTRDDAEYGGWGYCRTLPRKPNPDHIAPPLVESNLSATRCALDALRAAGISARDPAFAKALVFVERCQNIAVDPKSADPAFDNGGFHFIHGDPVRNKAGIAGKDRHGRERFTSYGSTTADGLRSLLLCGLGDDHPRVAAARQWLDRHFDATEHPGRYVERHESNRQAVYFYYCASLAAVLPSLDPATASDRRASLVAELARRQQADGSWANGAHAMREDDPIAATALATTALSQCR